MTKAVDIVLASILAYSGDPETESIESLVERITDLDKRMCNGEMPERWAKPVGILTHDDILIDVLYANDCCAQTIGRLPIASHVQDAEITCERCRSTFRYTLGAYDVGGAKLVWRWRMRNDGLPRRDEDVLQLSTVLHRIATHQAEVASDTD